MGKQSKKKRKEAERQARPAGGMALVARWPIYDIDRVMATLLRTVGEGNFHFLVGTGPVDLFGEDE